MTDIQEPINIADIAYHQHAYLANSATSHQAQDGDDQSAVARKLSEQLQALRGAGDTNELSSPQLTLHSPKGIQALSDKSLHLASAHHTAVTASQHISLSAGKSLLATVRGAVRFFAQLAGIRLFAAKGKIELDAQTDGIDVLALNNIKIHSNNDWVEITAKQGILINAGGSYIRITPQGIEQGTDGDWKALATSHELSGANSLPIQTNSPLFNDEMFVLKDQAGKAVAGFRYRIVDDDGNEYFGVTDSEGRTDRVFTGAKISTLKVYPDTRLDDKGS